MYKIKSKLKLRNLNKLDQVNLNLCIFTRKVYKWLIVVLSATCLTNCTTYQKHFGGTSHTYATAQSGKKLTTGSKKYQLKPSDRYSIPNVPGIWGGEVPSVLPPDHIDPA